MEQLPKNEEPIGSTKKLTEEEMDKVDPASGLTWRELVYGVSKKTLKDEAKGKELKDKKKNLYERLFPKKKEKKEVSREQAMKTIDSFHEIVMKTREFLPMSGKKYFPNLPEDVGKAQMELVAIQTLMRSEDPAMIEAVKEILKKEKSYVEIGGERRNLYEILFPNDAEENEDEVKKFSVSPNISVGTDDPEFIAFLENNEGTKMPEDLSVKKSSAEQVAGKQEINIDEALKSARDYFDSQAKIYGMLDPEVRKFTPKIGEKVEENRLAILAIESCMHLHDKVSLEAVQEILKEEKKFIKANRNTPLASLFAQIKPQIEMILKK